MDRNGSNNTLVELLKDVVEREAWHCLGPVVDLKENHIRRLYGDTEADDIVLVYDVEEDSFHAMDALCSHEGGPLDLGDIEDINGMRCLVCPWHNYEFRLCDGISESTGLQQDIYPLMEADGMLYIRTGEMIYSLKPRSDNSSAVTISNSDSMPQAPASTDKTLTSLAYQVLVAGDPLEKIKLSQLFGEDWSSGRVADIGSCFPPDHPVRSESLHIVDPGLEPKRGKGGSLASRISILHSLANIELWAIDLSWDIIARYYPHYRLSGQLLPKEFVDDFIKVALDETKHFTLLANRLKEMGSFFGALPVHNGLWESAEVTNDSLLARLAVVHMVHEARGLDVQPTQINKFERQKDQLTLPILHTVYEEEITHVATGMKWFTYICENSQPPLDSVKEFHKIVKKYFKGYLKPPFNIPARTKAGMTPEWYEPLVKPKATVQMQSMSQLHTSSRGNSDKAKPLLGSPPEGRLVVAQVAAAHCTKAIHHQSTVQMVLKCIRKIVK